MTIRYKDVLETQPDTRVPDPHQDAFSKATLGFWVYLMTDCLVFASLFCTYAVLRTSTFGGPGPKDLFDLKITFLQTMILLCSTVTCGCSVLAAVKSKKRAILGFLGLTFILGASFVATELIEFTHLVQQGASWTKSAFLSSFFTLVGTHGLHVTVGLLWMVVMMGQIFYSGVTVETFRRLVLFSLFWHFLDLIWIFIFTFVYLMGVI